MISTLAIVDIPPPKAHHETSSTWGSTHNKVYCLALSGTQYTNMEKDTHHAAKSHFIYNLVMIHMFATASYMNMSCLVSFLGWSTSQLLGWLMAQHSRTWPVKGTKTKTCDFPDIFPQSGWLHPIISQHLYWFGRPLFIPKLLPSTLGTGRWFKLHHTPTGAVQQRVAAQLDRPARAWHGWRSAFGAAERVEPASWQRNLEPTRDI